LCRVDDIIGKDASLYKLSCEFGVLNACYDMGDIELLTRKVETSHWKKEEPYTILVVDHQMPHQQ
jgi:hypothetical protein